MVQWFLDETVIFTVYYRFTLGYTTGGRKQRLRIIEGEEDSTIITSLRFLGIRDYGKWYCEESHQFWTPCELVVWKSQQSKYNIIFIRKLRSKKNTICLLAQTHCFLLKYKIFLKLICRALNILKAHFFLQRNNIFYYSSNINCFLKIANPDKKNSKMIRNLLYNTKETT